MTMSIRTTGLLLLATASTTLGQAPESTDVGGKINWVFSYEEGQVLSKLTNKPMFVVFRCER